MGHGFLAYNTDQAYAMPLGGIASNLGLAGQVAKVISFGRGREIRVGGQIGINQYPVIGRSGTSELTGSYGWGFLLKQDEFTLAFSQPAAQMQEMNWRASSPMYIKGQYIFKTNSGNALKSGTVVRFIKGLDTQIDLYSVFWLQERLGFGLWWQNTGSELGNPALIGSLEIPLGKNFKVGYGYDFWVKMCLRYRLELVDQRIRRHPPRPPDFTKFFSAMSSIPEMENLLNLGIK